MPVPKRKRSKARRDKRFANKGMKEKSFSLCSGPNCGKALMSHAACQNCGFYKGAKVMTGKMERDDKRQQAKAAKQAKAKQAAPVAQEGEAE